MHALKRHKFLVTALALGLVFLAVYGYRTITAKPTWTTAAVDRGTVTEVVAISGFVETLDAVNLSFPQAGQVTDVFVRRGDTVTAGQLLATQGAATLIAERAALVAAREQALASRSELEAGPTGESRAVTEATVAAAETALRETIRTENERVAAARRALLSTDLEAVTDDTEENATPPTVTGSFTCNTEGVYRVSLYRSGTDSGYSFRTTGLEAASGPATTNQPSALGTCGLFLTFSADVDYANTEWTITVPNTRSASYAANKSALDLALRQQEQNVAAARTTLAIAENEGTAANAAPRVEALIRANAAVQAAEANIAAIDARIRDTSITAPFSGTVTDVAVVPGETASLTPVITMIGDASFSLTARVPEIDIRKIAVGQPASIRFDAASDETFTGAIRFVSPLPTTIDGVAYFDAEVELTAPPSWLRAGLNADVDITLTEERDTLRLPERFITRTPEGTTVLIPRGDTAVPTPVTVRFIGNDGFVAIEGLELGTTVIAP